MSKEAQSADREIISFGGTVDEVGTDPQTGEAGVVITVPDNCAIELSGVPPAMAKEFALHLFETVYFSIKVKS